MTLLYHNAPAVDIGRRGLRATRVVWYAGARGRTAVDRSVRGPMGIRFFIYGLLGWCMEIAWTGLPKRRPVDWRLPSNTYLWMLPLYGLVAPLYEPLHDALRTAGVAWPIRGAIYAVGIMGLEVVAGWLLERLTGRCPWDYRSHARWHWRGYTRFDYAPLWFVVGLGLEPLHDFLVRLTPAIAAALLP